MNLHFTLRRLLGRSGARLGAGSSLSASARILNPLSDPERIRIGANCRVEGELFVFAHGGRINMGDWCYVGPNTRIWSASNVNIGHRVLISHSVNIFDSLTHPLDPVARHAQFRQISMYGHPRSIDLDERPVMIGDDAWIGAGTTVLRGVVIGARAVVGAGAVVTQDVAPDTVVVGNPARVVRHLVAEKP